LAIDTFESIDPDLMLSQQIVEVGAALAGNFGRFARFAGARLK